MSTNQLTTVKLKSLTDNDAGTILNDGGGLRGRVRRNRHGQLIVQFEYRYRAGTKSRTVKVEQWPNTSLAQIRNLCTQIKADLAQGIDPIDAKADQKTAKQLHQAQEIERKREEIERLAIEAANTRTFGDSVHYWFERELTRRKDNGAETIRSFDKDILPPLTKIPLADVTRPMLLDILDQVVARGANIMANRLFGDLKQFFTFAVSRDWVQAHPLSGLTKDKIGGKQTERERYLSEQEIIELHQQIPTAKLSKKIEHAIWIMLATGCRVGELSTARWEHIDFISGEWLIPADNSKNSKSHLIYLSDFAKQHFEGLKAVTCSNDWCIPSRNEQNHIGLKSITKQIYDRTTSKALSNRSSASETLLLSGGRWTPHDLRRTAATTMGELGTIGEVIERCLNHQEQNKLKRIYQRHELRAEQREAWFRLGERLSLLTTHATNQNIVIGPFNRQTTPDRASAN